MANFYNSFFLEGDKTERIVGTIVAHSAVGYSVEVIVGGGVIQVIGNGFDVGDRVIVENGAITQKLSEELEIVEIVI